MLNFSFDEKQRTYLVTALKIYRDELQEVSNTVLSHFLRRGFREDVTAVESLLGVLSKASDEPMSDEVLRQNVLACLKRGYKIEAIRFVRAQRNLGLKEAKDFVDSLS